MSALQQDERHLSYGDAIQEATAQSMERDPSVIVMGEGVDDEGGIFGSTRGLTRFGSHRCFDTPLSEEAVTGIVNGAALSGLRPVMVHARVEFMLLAMNQILTHAAQWHSIYGEDNAMPAVHRSVIGRGWGQGAQHSQSLPSLFMNTPGLQVVMPAMARDAKGLLCQALMGNRPVIFMEHRQLYALEEHVPEEHFTIPFGKARIHRHGDDLTIVAYSQMLHEAIRAAEVLEAQGVDVEVIDPRTLVPLDEETIFNSVRKTGRLLIVDNAFANCGFGAELAARCASQLFYDLKAPVDRVAFPRIPTPSSHVLEHAYYPNWETITAAAQRVLDRQPQRREEHVDPLGYQESW